jgi:Fe-S cluster assembly iron-binding protein IscA
MAYIRYIKKSNGQEYASLADTNRSGKQVKQEYLGNLGLVVDKEAGVFQSRERGTFRYTLEEGFCDLSDAYSNGLGSAKSERLILDFGDSFFLSQYFERQVFRDAFHQVLPEQTDTLLSLMFYRILTDKKANCYADMWWQGNYASILFPGAKLASQRVSEFLVDIGGEEIQRRFFHEYFRILYGSQSATGILIDSSGCPNASKMSVTQISNHNGDISLEARLIYVIDRVTGMPIYFRYCPGNIVDVTTLCTTLAELRQYSIAIDYAIVDAGYCSEDNILELYENHVRFLTRLAPNRTLFKDVAKEHLPSLMTSANALKYGNRLLYMKKVSVKLYGNAGFAYIGVDVDSKNQQMKRAAFAAIDDKLPPEEADVRMSKLGVFMIISSEDIETAKILPLYYTRQQIEQVFDLTKNNADLLPLRIQNEDTFRGHLMITFLATVLLQKLQRDIIAKSKKKDKINPEGALMILRNQKCKVYSNAVVPQEAFKHINDIYKMFEIKCPTFIAAR